MSKLEMILAELKEAVAATQESFAEQTEILENYLDKHEEVE